MMNTTQSAQHPPQQAQPSRPLADRRANPPKLPPDVVKETIMARPGVAPIFSDSPNARSKTITVASGTFTNGALNQLPSKPSGYTIGLTEDTGSRRTMEDAHSFVTDFAGVRGQGYFAIFDGHAGKHAAEWCGAHFHEHLLDALEEQASTAESHKTKISVPDILNQAFQTVDAELSQMSEQGTTHSGCTAVTAFLRLEDDHGHQPISYVRTAKEMQRNPSMFPIQQAAAQEQQQQQHQSGGDTISSSNSGVGKIKSAIQNITGKPTSSEPESTSKTTSSSADPIASLARTPSTLAATAAAIQFAQATRKVLYVANAGDARAVLSRGGKAVRLTYDHKGSDSKEAKRIKEAGGFVMNNRVNGVLAVTRSLGDSSMKEFVVGAPYTTETTLGPEDDILIIACDGLWDVIEDQAAVDLVRTKAPNDPQAASKLLVDYALKHFSSDNISVLVVKFDHSSEGEAR